MCIELENMPKATSKHLFRYTLGYFLFIHPIPLETFHEIMHLSPPFLAVIKLFELILIAHLKALIPAGSVVQGILLHWQQKGFKGIMGISPLPLLSIDCNDQMSESKRRLKVKKQRVWGKTVKRHWRCRRRSRSMLMKRIPEGCTRTLNPFQKKVKTLKKLIPNKESMGLGGLFRDTAEYIMCLQMRVKVMQIMIKVLTGSNE
ncbi:hypothetical protein Gohar_017489 [Gossypium harknessii]|uniref:BHLH domain-containing protein n=1 Tax=Gossypium harknessii TaxID=34285 RepID=A0A7J9G641_9ROSI|nr:hypothetical protein [Gossypium harknessii]